MSFAVVAVIGLFAVAAFVAPPHHYDKMVGCDNASVTKGAKDAIEQAQFQGLHYSVFDLKDVRETK